MTPPDFAHDLLRSAAFRLTLRFAAIFIVALLGVGIVGGVSTRLVIEKRLRAEAAATLAAFREIAGDGPAAVAAALRDLDPGTLQQGVAFGHQDAAGKLLAGDITLSGPTEGWSTWLPEGDDEDEALWVLSERLPDGGWISVGVSSETFHDTLEFMRGGALWVVGIGLPLALFSGALLSRMVAARVGRIARTAARIEKGEISQRVPLTGSSDEFDRLSDAINTMLDRIEDLTRNLRNVSYGIAHELRTPLARLRIRLTDLGDDRSDAAGRAILVEKAIDDIDQTLKTFDALLKIGQIEAGAERRGFEQIDFSRLVAELHEIYQPVAEGSGRHLTVGVDPGIEVRGDRTLLIQMISNLLENAIEHTPVGSAICMELANEHDQRRLVVADDGPGIPRSEEDRVFDRFYRLDTSFTGKGRGLGLALVRSICGLHGFQLRLSHGSPGARFEVLLLHGEA